MHKVGSEASIGVMMLQKGFSMGQAGTAILRTYRSRPDLCSSYGLHGIVWLEIEEAALPISG
jgi:hypothetical protein